MTSFLLSDAATGPRVLASSWIPLEHAALCLDDECVFPIQRACPRCGSETWVLLAGFLTSPSASR